MTYFRFLTSRFNYIQRGKGEYGLPGWNTYNDGATSTPIDGTGGTPSITNTLTDVAPLRDHWSYVLTKGTVNAQGQGLSYDFEIDPGDTNLPFEILYYYKGSANYQAGDVRVFVYDKTGASVITPSLEFQEAQEGVMKASFTSSSSTSYRLIFHITTTNANDYTLKLDNIVVNSAVSTGGTIFGNFFSEESDLTTSSTTSTTFVNKLTLNTGIIPPSKYRISWYFEWTLSNSSKDFLSRVRVDSMTDLTNTVSQIRGGASNYYTNSGFGYYVTTSNINHTIQLDWASGGGATAFIRNAHIEIWQVSL